MTHSAISSRHNGALGSARPSDVVVSADGSRIYTAGADGVVRAYDGDTGQLVAEWQVGSALGAIDLSPDGTFLMVTEAAPISFTNSQNWPSNRATVAVHKVELDTGTVTTFLHEAAGTEWAFHDVAILADNSVLLTQKILPGWSGWAAPELLDTATGVFTSLSVGVRHGTTLSDTPSGEYVLFAENDISDAPLRSYQTGIGFTAYHGGYQDNVQGFNRGVHARGPNLVAQHVYGSGLHIYSPALVYQINLTSLYPGLIDSVAGLAFDSTGAFLFVLDTDSDSILQLSTSNWSIVGSIPVGANLGGFAGDFGSRLIVGPDMRYFTVVTDSGLLQVDNPNVSSTRTGTGRDDALDGTALHDVLQGLGGDDVLLAGNGSDRLEGGAGNDDLSGGRGDDDLDGGGDDDVLTGGLGSDSLDGGEGVDTVDYSLEDGAGGIIVNLTGSPIFGSDDLVLQHGQALDSYGSVDTLWNVENFRTGSGSDTVRGGSGANRIETGGGADYLFGGGGADILVGGEGNDQYYIYAADSATFEDMVVELPDGGFDQIRTTLSAFSLAGLPEVESLFGIVDIAFTLTGNDGNNYIIGNNSADILEGGLGNDKLEGQGGDDTMRGGIGDDEYVVNDIGDVVEENSGEGTDLVWTTLATYSLFGTNIENLFSATGIAHDFRGNQADNEIHGAGGDDILRLHDGGDDIAGGGEGNDSFLLVGALTGADVIDGGPGRDELTLQGDYSAGVTLGAITGVEVMVLLPGSDTRFGAPGTENYSYRITTTDQNVASGVLMNVDGNRLRAGENLVFDGSAETNGAFYVFAGKGVDTLTGGAKNDAFLFRGPGNFTGADTVNGGAGFDELALRGDYIGANKVVFGAATISGIEAIVVVSGHDLRYGKFAGDYSFDLTMNEANVASGQAMIVDAGTLRSGERLVFDGSAETDGGRFTMFGGKGNDALTGGSGADSIRGGLGADVMKGNGGADTFVYRDTAESTTGAVDQILDFLSGTDKIDLSRIDANTLVGGDEAFTWIGSNAFSGSGSAGQLRAYQDGANWFVEGDTNGDGAADLVIQLTGGPIAQSDFLP